MKVSAHPWGLPGNTVTNITPLSLAARFELEDPWAYESIQEVVNAVMVDMAVKAASLEDLQKDLGEAHQQIQHLANLYGNALDHIDDMQQEIGRHHKQFDQWEEMANKGARQMVEGRGSMKKPTEEIQVRHCYGSDIELLEFSGGTQADQFQTLAKYLRDHPGLHVYTVKSVYCDDGGYDILEVFVVVEPGTQGGEIRSHPQRLLPRMSYGG